MSPRIEKGYGSRGRDCSPRYWPRENGLARLVEYDIALLNKVAWKRIADLPPREMMTMPGIDATDADASGGEPNFLTDGASAWKASSGDCGYSVGKTPAIVSTNTGLIRPGEIVHIAILGSDHEAGVLTEPPFDPMDRGDRGNAGDGEMIAGKEGLLDDIRGRFAHVDTCPVEGPRIFFGNARGALHLTSVV